GPRSGPSPRAPAPDGQVSPAIAPAPESPEGEKLSGSNSRLNGPCRGDHATPDASGVGPGWGRRDFTSSRPRSNERLGRPAGACMSDGPTPDPPPAIIATDPPRTRHRPGSRH